MKLATPAPTIATDSVPQATNSVTVTSMKVALKPRPVISLVRATATRIPFLRPDISHKYGEHGPIDQYIVADGKCLCKSRLYVTNL